MAEAPKDWDAKADFMRRYNAVHAEWGTGINAEGFAEEKLLKLTLGPAPIAKSVAAAPADPATPKGIAARLMKQHEVQFAHSRVKPPLPSAVPVDDVPRAVRAKQGASRGNQAKASKRAT